MIEINGNAVKIIASIYECDRNASKTANPGYWQRKKAALMGTLEENFGIKYNPQTKENRVSV